MYAACFEQFEIVRILGGITNLTLILVLAGLLICLLCTGCKILPCGWLGLVELILTNLRQVVVDTIPEITKVPESLPKGCNLDGRSITNFSIMGFFSRGFAQLRTSLTRVLQS